MSTPYTHIVSFKYRPDVSEETRAEVHRRFLALKHQCRVQSSKHAESSPTQSGQYIASLTGGSRNISPEGAGKDYDHLFVVIFHTSEHVAYYLDEDPAHDDFKAFVGPLIEDAFIYDFS
ncbi:unnamed protein product [Parajaminaea phylloscopi]